MQRSIACMANYYTIEQHTCGGGGVINSTDIYAASLASVKCRELKCQAISRGGTADSPGSCLQAELGCFALGGESVGVVGSAWPCVPCR